MTEVAMCNVNRPGIWCIIRVTDIEGQKTQIVSNEHQLQTEDHKTNLTLRITSQKSVWDAVNKHFTVNRKCLAKDNKESDILMLGKYE